MMGFVLAIALVAAACAKSTPSASGGSPSAATTSAASSGGGGYGGGAYGGHSSSPSGGGGAGAAAATVSQINYQFSPSNLTVTKGDTIAVKNSTTGTPHNFTISGKGIDVTNDAGQTQSVVINLAPGTYTFFCRFHESLGMKGTLVVK
jgi:plastocyanin